MNIKDIPTGIPCLRNLESLIGSAARRVLRRKEQIGGTSS